MKEALREFRHVRPAIANAQSGPLKKGEREAARTAICGWSTAGVGANVIITAIAISAGCT